MSGEGPIARRPRRLSVALSLFLSTLLVGLAPASDASTGQGPSGFDPDTFAGHLVVDTRFSEPENVSERPVSAQPLLSESALLSAMQAASDSDSVSPEEPASRDLSDQDLGLSPESPSGQIRLCFTQSVPQRVRREALTAASRWDETLTLTGPVVEIDVYWLELANPVILGAAGPTTFVIDPLLPHPEARYPVALANELLGTDHAPRARCDRSESGEIVLVLNSGAGSDSGGWTIGDEPLGGGPFSEEAIDLQTTLLHEFAHGFGFIGSAELDENGELAWPSDADTPMVYDLFTRRCIAETPSGCNQDDSLPVEVGDLEATLSGQLWFDTILGPLVELEAPIQWDGGSSFSHLDEYRYPLGNPFALMTPYIDAEQRIRSVDTATAAVMQSIGWQLDARPLPLRVDWTRAGPNRIQLVVESVDLRDGTPPTSFEIRILKVESDPFGNLSRTLAYQPLEASSRQVVIQGLDNGVLYEVELRTKDATQDAPARSGPLLLLAAGSGGERANQVYATLLNRQPSAEEAATFIRLSESNDLRDAMVDVYRHSEVAQEEAVVRLYLGLLDRQPDTAGLSFWVQRLRSGVPLETVADEFISATRSETGSSEDDGAYVRFVYQSILGRTPESTGLRYWTQRLQDGTTRGRVLLEISESEEHRRSRSVLPTLIVASSHWLGRPPTADEQRLWEPALKREGLGELLAVLETGAIKIVTPPPEDLAPDGQEPEVESG